MQSRNADLNSVSSKNTKALTKNTRSASLEQNNDDYLDLVLRKEISQWFQKNSSSENETGAMEMANSQLFKAAPNVISLGYNGD
jgi:hypothetical protein